MGHFLIHVVSPLRGKHRHPAWVDRFKIALKLLKNQQLMSLRESDTAATPPLPAVTSCQGMQCPSGLSERTAVLH